MREGKGEHSRDCIPVGKQKGHVPRDRSILKRVTIEGGISSKEGSGGEPFLIGRMNRTRTKNEVRKGAHSDGCEGTA
jgi:hypothetical protein